MAALRPQIVPSEADRTPVSSNDAGDSPAATTRVRLSWAQVLKRVFANAFMKYSKIGALIKVLDCVPC